MMLGEVVAPAKNRQQLTTGQWYLLQSCGGGSVAMQKQKLERDSFGAAMPQGVSQSHGHEDGP